MRRAMIDRRHWGMAHEMNRRRADDSQGDEDAEPEQ